MRDYIKKRKENSLILQITNIYWYIGFFVVSLIVICISNWHQEDYLNILENVCYSILAATVMAFFIDYNSLINAEKERKVFKKRYFEEVNYYLSLIIGHLLWLEKNLDDDSINWDLEPKICLITISGSQNKDDQKSSEISFDDAVSLLNEMSNRYLPVHVKDMTKTKKNRLNKVFEILFHELDLLIGKVNKINDEKIILEIKDYVCIKDINQFLDNFYLCYSIMMIENQRHMVIKLLTSSIMSVRQFGNYDNKINVSVKDISFNIVDLLEVK